jgi:hypothetical protein
MSGPLEDLLADLRDDIKECLRDAELTQNPDAKAIFVGAAENLTRKADALQRFMSRSDSPQDLEKVGCLLMDRRGNARLYARSAEDISDPERKAEMTGLSERWMKQAEALSRALEG